MPTSLLNWEDSMGEGASLSCPQILPKDGADLISLKHELIDSFHITGSILELEHQFMWK
jgi:hypothetical protein